jgi:hypothetical protein
MKNRILLECPRIKRRIFQQRRLFITKRSLTLIADMLNTPLDNALSRLKSFGG